jgi:hypothetical protein
MAPCACGSLEHTMVLRASEVCVRVCDGCWWARVMVFGILLLLYCYRLLLPAIVVALSLSPSLSPSLSLSLWSVARCIRCNSINCISPSADETSIWSTGWHDDVLADGRIPCASRGSVRISTLVPCVDVPSYGACVIALRRSCSSCHENNKPSVTTLKTLMSTNQTRWFLST